MIKYSYSIIQNRTFILNLNNVFINLSVVLVSLLSKSM